MLIILIIFNIDNLNLIQIDILIDNLRDNSN